MATAARRIAAFLLKYRTIEKKVDGIPQMDMDTAGRYGIADGIQALKVVRAHAPAWGLDRNKVGMIGFSAGAMVTSAAMLQRDPTLRPSFAALIYGAPFGKMPAIPAGLPPVFMAWAKDDRVALVPGNREVPRRARRGRAAARDARVREGRPRLRQRRRITPDTHHPRLPPALGTSGDPNR